MQAAGEMPLVAVLRGLSPERAAGTARALVAAGFRILEVPLNGEGALRAISEVRGAVGNDAAKRVPHFPGELNEFGGRQAARTVHFLACFSFVGFIVLHILQVVLTGGFNNLRSMVTGWFVIKHEARC